MNLHQYQDAIDQFCRYPQPLSQRYTALGLVGEVGEIANQVKKIWRDDESQLTPARTEKLRDELGDVLFYATRWAHHAGFMVGTFTISIGEDIDELNLEPAGDIFTAAEHLGAIASGALSFSLFDEADQGDKLDFAHALFNAIATMADFLETDIEEVAQANVDKLTGRVERGTLGGTLGGSGDGR